MRSAPCLVRENTSTDSSAASFSRWISAGTLPAGETSTTYCVTVSAGVDRAPISTSAGFFSTSFATPSISFDIVAEKSSVCRAAGVFATMRRMAGRKPMSSMRSASSSTSTCSAREIDVALFHEIDQPSGRGHDEVDAAAQRLDLRAFTDAAEDRRVAQRQVPAVGAHVLLDLRDQLARRRDHQHAHGALRRRRGRAARASAARTPRSCRCRSARRR